MPATTFLPSPPRLPHRLTNPSYKNRLITTRRVPINAQQDGESDRKSVDENMIVLKMRIKKMKQVLDSGGERAVPLHSDWKEWEKRIFTHYHEGVCDSMEMLKAYLINTRPSVALGLVALIAMSVPFSSSVVLGNAIKVARGLLAGCHVCIDIDF